MFEVFCSYYGNNGSQYWNLYEN